MDTEFTAVVCCFAELDELGPRAKYQTIKEAALRAGRFSVWDATRNTHFAAVFTELEKDPEVETFRNPPAFPWVGIRRRKS